MEWKEYKLGDIATFRTGKLNSNAAVKDGKYPFFTCSPETLSIDNYAFDQKAILLAGNNAEGNFCIKYYEGKFNAYQRTYVITPNKDVNIKFLFYALSLCLKEFKSISQGSATRFLTAVILNSFTLNIPSLPIQSKISGILSSIDAKIENNNKINANLEAQAAALFKSWFVDFEPFRDGEFVESELGMIPKGWKVGTLSDIAIINPSLKLSKGTEATYLDMKNMPTSGSFPSAWEKKLYNGGMKFSYGDTLMARITPCLENGKVAYANFLQENEVAFGSTEYIVLRPKNGILPEVFYFLCRYPDFIGYATKNMNGSSGRQRVSGETIGNYKIVIPPIDKIKPLIGYFKSVMGVVSNNGFENQRLSSLRDTLLPKLMSGEIDLENISI